MVVKENKLSAVRAYSHGAGYLFPPFGKRADAAAGMDNLMSKNGDEFPHVLRREIFGRQGTIFADRGIIVIRRRLPARSPACEVRSAVGYILYQARGAAGNRHHGNSVEMRGVGGVFFAEFSHDRGEPTALQFGNKPRRIRLYAFQRLHSLGASNGVSLVYIIIIAIENLRKLALCAAALRGKASENGNADSRLFRYII